MPKRIPTEVLEAKRRLEEHLIAYAATGHDERDWKILSDWMESVDSLPGIPGMVQAPSARVLTAWGIIAEFILVRGGLYEGTEMNVLQNYFDGMAVQPPLTNEFGRELIDMGT